MARSTDTVGDLSPTSGGSPTVALSFHWNCTVWPESRSAFKHHESALRAVAAEFGTVLGHAHPRYLRRIAADYRRAGIEVVAAFDDILDRADLYVCDNSSTMYEFASTGRPVVVLNAPWYRRDVEHGLRFWADAGLGPHADEPSDVVQACHDALESDRWDAEREAIVDRVYAYRDGHAAERAADAILRWAPDAQVSYEPRHSDPFRGRRVSRPT